MLEESEKNLCNKIRDIIESHPNYSHDDIARELNILTWRVTNLIKKYQIPYRNKNERYDKNEKSEIKKKLIDLIISQPDLNEKEISNIMGISLPYISKLIREDSDIPYIKKSSAKPSTLRVRKNYDLIKSLIIQGKSQNEIAKIFEASSSSISTYIKEVGLDKICSRGGRKVNWEDPILRDKLTKLVDEGKSILQMEEELGITHCTIAKGVRLLGLNYDFKPPVDWDNNGLLPKLKELVDSNKYYIPEMSRILGISKDPIRRAIKAYGLAYNSHNVGKHRRELFYEYYVNQELSLDEISNITGFAKNTIYRSLIREFKDRGEDTRLNKSLGEVVTMKALKSLGLSYVREEYHKDIALPYKCYVRIDFRVDYKNRVYWIEYNGEQHYNPNCRFYSTSSNSRNFKDQMGRDRCVREYAKNNGIILIEIPFIITDFYEIRDILRKIIIEGVNPETIEKLRYDIQN